MFFRRLNQTGLLDEDDERELGEEITTTIFSLVTNHAERRGGTIAAEPVLRGIACAYAAAYGLHARRPRQGAAASLGRGDGRPDHFPECAVARPERPR
jgi:hypothetical protein